MKKKGLILMLAFLMVFASAVIPSKCTFAKSKTGWYGKYSELSPEAEKAIRFKKGDRVQLKGKFTFTATKDSWGENEKKINKTFKFAKNAKLYVDESDAGVPIRKVSKKVFKEYTHFDVSHSAFKVKNGKIIKAIVSLN